MKYYLHKPSEQFDFGVVIRKVDSEGNIYSYVDGKWWNSGSVPKESFYEDYREMSKAEVVKWMLKQ